MTFWQDGQSFKPKRAYRFQMLIQGAGDERTVDVGRAGIGKVGIAPFVIKKVDKPGFAISESGHNYLNHTFYYPGKITWDEITVDIVDVIGRDEEGVDASAEVVKMLKVAGYRIPSDQNQLQTISKSDSIRGLGQVKIVQIDEIGNTVETWTLKNAWIKTVKFGTLDYTSEDLLNVGITLRYDFCEFDSVNSKDSKMTVGQGV